MRILFIAPIPPPITGNSLAVKVLVDEVAKHHEIIVINLNKKSFISGFNSLSRIKEILAILWAAFMKRHWPDVIYLSLSESFAGNLKDIFLYLIFCRKLGSVLVHLLGGSGIRSMMESKGLRSKINAIFYRRLSGAIVEGRTQAAIFAEAISPQRVHIVPNFAEDYLFLAEVDIQNKFVEKSPLRILFLSNLIYGKGHEELVDAYISLDPYLQSQLQISFVGGFENEKRRAAFLQKIDKCDNISYLGNFIGGEDKKALYRKSHIFCLPTYYPYEGQPISILEAYATGCVVITTDHGGIPDIFQNAINGYLVQKKSSASIKQILAAILRSDPDLLSMALYNRKLAFEKYRTHIFGNSIRSILENVRDFQEEK
jgi:glycosyltransferase involved in cell wall biosynthesis